MDITAVSGALHLSAARALHRATEVHENQLAQISALLGEPNGTKQHMFDPYQSKMLLWHDFLLDDTW
jgi:hypothetical protein